MRGWFHSVRAHLVNRGPVSKLTPFTKKVGRRRGSAGEAAPAAGAGVHRLADGALALLPGAPVLYGSRPTLVGFLPQQPTDDGAHRRHLDVADVSGDENELRGIEL